MKPYYQDEWVTIYHGDCREVLPSIPDKNIDLVFSDPPYNVFGLDAFVDLSIFRKWSKAWIDECFRTLKNNGTFILAGRQPVLSYLLVDICDSGKVFREFITWHKIDSITPAREYHSTNYEQFAIFTKWISRTFNFIPVESKSKNYGAERNAGCIWEHCKISSHHKEGTEHPTQKPELFLKRFIETYSNQNYFILDPFLGSGTTAVSAKKLNRKCIGIEIEEKYCEIAAKRCSQSVMRLEL